MPCFHRVSGGLNLAVSFKARKMDEIQLVALATIELFSTVADATSVVCFACSVP